MTSRPHAAKTRGRFLFRDYATAFKKHYPEVLAKHTPDGLAHETKTGTASLFHDDKLSFELASSDRFVHVRRRTFGAVENPLMQSNRNPLGAAKSYKGLLCLKPAYDLVAYCTLIWELKPRTIIEFGSLQGGSALWFADQLELCGHGVVHSFEKFINCVSTEAKHPRLTFHEADLNDLSSLSVRLFKQLEHPWLVVDDAHSNVEGLFHWVDRQMECGDYYVIEDYLTMPSVEDIQFLLNLGDSYLVDTRYTDACGYNNTCAPNAWLRKNSRGRRARPDRKRRNRPALSRTSPSS